MSHLPQCSYAPVPKRTPEWIYSRKFRRLSCCSTRQWSPSRNRISFENFGEEHVGIHISEGGKPPEVAVGSYRMRRRVDINK